MERRAFKLVFCGGRPIVTAHVRGELGIPVGGRRFHVEEEVDKYIVYFEMPGARRESIRVYTDGYIIVVNAEAHEALPGNREYRFRVKLEEEIDPEKTRARYREGVLVVEAPKKAGYREVKVE